MREAKKVTAEQFCEAWCAVWTEKSEQEKSRISSKLSGDGTWTEWTKCMLTGSDAFLKSVATKLGFQDKWQHGGGLNIDMVFLTDPENGYPPIFDVMIEHENDKYVENEMWKLMYLRSPLKVIVFYEHHFQSMSSPPDTICLSKKLGELIKMLHETNAAFPENENTEYLFIIGSVESRDAKIQWRWASYKQPSLQQLC